MPATFSRRTYLGATARITRSVSGHLFLGSSAPRLGPAVENGGQGKPAVMMSTTPLNCSPLKEDMSEKTGASDKMPSRILALSISWGYFSHST